MEILSVYSEEFKEYGAIVPGEYTELLKVLSSKPCPEVGTVYCPSDKDLEATPSFEYFSKNVYGDMPVQLGYCNGHNNKLNCLEYHRDSEINLANEEFVLLLGRRGEIENGKFDTAKTKAFRVPAGVAVEVFATSMHYAPIGEHGAGFRVLVVLPRGTNVNSLRLEGEKELWATNKWLLAHPESKEAKNGAYVGLVGKNIVID
ncbi:MAG: DUF4867 family protein [Bacilli bacterium]|nr:DUF4867 family protein [Bacilli bacterium]